MPDKVPFELVTPARLLVSVAADMVVVPGGDGDFGVLPGHAPLLSTVRPGTVDVHDGGKVTNRYFVAGGFAEVTDERCTVVAEEAMAVGDLTRAAAEERLATAKSAPDAKEAAEGQLVAEAMLAALAAHEASS